MSDFATAEQQAYIYIQDLVVSGALAGGSRLHPEEISRALGISRMPVREAIRQLAAENYVTLRPNRGPIVTSRTPEQVVELFEIRSALEGLAMQLAASQITPGAIEDMKVELAHLRQLESDRIAWVDHHDTFHDALCQLSMRPYLCAEVRRVRLSIKPYLRHYVKGHVDPEIKGYEHECILEALQSGHPRRAEQAMRRHVMANAEAIANCLPVSSAASVHQRHKGSHRDDLGAAWPGDLRVAATRR